MTVERPWWAGHPLVIRASSLPTWADCPRRWLATTRRRLVQEFGHRLNEERVSIGAPCGSGTHAGAAELWRGYLDSGTDFAPLPRAEERAIAEFEARLGEEPTIFDNTTPDRDSAHFVIRKMLKAYREHQPRDREPVAVEHELIADLGEGWFLVGHCDLFAYQPRLHILDDLKTGVLRPTPTAQLGGYAGMLQAEGRPPDQATMTYVRRTRRTADQPPPLKVRFDPVLCQRVASRAVKAIRREVDGFHEDGDLLRFPANTSSTLCGAKYCPAFGTSACPESHAKMEPDDGQ